jgi:hypothetical protein
VSLDDDIEFARRMVSPDGALGRWLARERESLSASLGREPTQSEFAEHALKRFCADVEVRRIAIEAAREAADGRLSPLESLKRKTARRPPTPDGHAERSL